MYKYVAPTTSHLVHDSSLGVISMRPALDCSYSEPSKRKCFTDRQDLQRDVMRTLLRLRRFPVVRPRINNP